MIGIEEGEEAQVKGTENIFDKIMEENFPTLKKETPVKVHKTYRTPNGQSQKRNPVQFFPASLPGRGSHPPGCFPLPVNLCKLCYVV